MNSQRENKLGFIEWLGFRKKPLFENAIWLGPVIGFVLSLVAGVFFIAAIAMLFDFVQAIFKAEPYADDIKGEAIRNIGLVLAAIFGAPFIVWRTVLAGKQAQIADEALFNEKINFAAQNLLARRNTTRVIENEGIETILTEVEDDLVARAAAIDRLEGLASERQESAPRIARLLAAYVRGNFSCIDLEPTAGITQRKTPRIDLQMAVDTIGRVYGIAAQYDPSHWRLNLRSCNLDGVSLLNGYFRAADFSGSRLEAAVLAEGNFEGCIFRNTLLNYADFRKANLKGVKFDSAVINQPMPTSGGFVRSINLAGDLTGTTFIAADISAISYLGNTKVLSKTFGTKDTKLSAEMRLQKLDDNEHSLAHTLRSVRRSQALSEIDLEKIKKLDETGFQFWSPYDSSDLSTGWIYEEFLSELNMKKWPYTN